MAYFNACLYAVSIETVNDTVVGKLKYHKYAQYSNIIDGELARQIS